MPTRYEHCTPEEKLRRLRIQYVDGRMTLEAYEEFVGEALKQADDEDKARIR